MKIFSKPLNELKLGVESKYTYFSTLKQKHEIDKRTEDSLKLDKEISTKLEKIKELENKESEVQKKLDDLLDKLNKQIENELNG